MRDASSDRDDQNFAGGGGGVLNFRAKALYLAPIFGVPRLRLIYKINNTPHYSFKKRDLSDNNRRLHKVSKRTVFRVCAHK